MRIRKMSFTDYGISDKRATELLAYCRQSGDTESVRRAAAYANPIMADVIADSLTSGKGYWWLTRTRSIYYGKSDFYAYRRLAVALLNVLLTEGDPGFWKAEVLEDWLTKRRRGADKRRPATRSQVRSDKAQRTQGKVE